MFPGGIRAIVAQLDRAFGSDPEGQRFESSRSHQKGMAHCAMPFFFLLVWRALTPGSQRAYLRVLRAEGQVQCAVFSQRGLEFLAGQRPHLSRRGRGRKQVLPAVPALFFPDARRIPQPLPAGQKPRPFAGDRPLHHRDRSGRRLRRGQLLRRTLPSPDGPKPHRIPGQGAQRQRRRFAPSFINLPIRLCVSGLKCCINSRIQ